MQNGARRQLRALSEPGRCGRIASVAGGRGRGAVAACRNFRCGRIRKPDPLASGRSRDGIEHYQRLATDTEAAAGRDQPDAIAARARLASAYRRGGKPKDAIALYQRTLADCERYLGLDHPLTRTVRDGLEAVAQSGTRRP